MDDPTIPANDRFIQYTYSGGELVFQYDFPVYAAADVTVYVKNLRLNFPIDYTVTINPAFDGGTVTLHNVPIDGDLITIVGNTPIVRTEYYGNQAVVSPTALDAECSKTVMRMQQLNTNILGCLKNQLAETEEDNTILPLTEDRKGKIAAWDRQTGALTYFGNRGMDEIYLSREKNLSDLMDIDAAKENLHIIDGRQLENNSTPMEYRQVLDFNKAFKLLNDINKTVVSLALTVANVGSGIPIVTSFSGNTIWARTVRAVGNISVSIASDGSIVLADTASTRGYTYKFDEETWGENKRISVPSSLHKVADDDNVLVNIRDQDGYSVTCNIMVEGDGTVHIFSNIPFSGTALIYGGLYPMVPSGLIVNPMTEKGDLIISSDDNGSTDRLPAGNVDQILAIGNDGFPTYKTLGAVAWKESNIPDGVPLLDGNNQIPSEFLPFSTMTYKGTFGSPTSSTGGDLPTIGVMDGDIFVCDTDYTSPVAGKPFLIGQWAIFNGSGWDIIPLPKQPDSVPVGSVIPFAGSTTPPNYLPCNGFVLDRTVYSQLFVAIGTTYNTGQEQSHQFSIPNYNNERRFLQASTTAGKKTDAGLPNIYGRIFNNWQRRNPYGSTVGGDGAFRSTVLDANADVKAAYGPQYDSDRNTIFNAADSNPIYGRSNTVQPPAQDIIYLIKFQR